MHSDGQKVKAFIVTYIVFMLLSLNTLLNRQNLNQNEKLYEVCGKGNINKVKSVLDQNPPPDVNWKCPVS